MSALIQATFVILRKRQLCERIGLSPAQVYAMLDSKSPSYDPSFPRQIRLGGSNRSSAVGWLQHEVQAWLEDCVQSSRGERTTHKSTRSTSAKSGDCQ
jgi:prophage regulatory protein